MSLAGKNLHLCSCNGTMPLDAAALARALALSGTPAVQTMLCQKELAAFAGRAEGDVVVACTQEAESALAPVQPSTAEAESALAPPRDPGLPLPPTR